MVNAPYNLREEILMIRMSNEDNRIDVQIFGENVWHFITKMEIIMKQVLHCIISQLYYMEQTII